MLIKKFFVINVVFEDDDNYERFLYLGEIILFLGKFREEFIIFLVIFYVIFYFLNWNLEGGKRENRGKVF